MHEDLRHRIADALEIASLLTICLTISATPWFLGGAIPHGRLVLLAGSILSAILCLLAVPLKAWTLPRLPFTAYPLMCLALLCVVQLLPVFSPPVSQLQHAVRSDLLPELLAETKLPSTTPRSVMPEETRLYLAQFLALSLVSLVLWKVVDTVRRLRMALFVLAMNGCAMSALALCQTFGATTVIIGNQWKVSPTPPFGCFVNPNNAAGWLLVSAICGLVLTGIEFSRGSTVPANDRRSSLERLTSGIRNILAGLSTTQILATATTILMLCGCVATLSRGGIVATGLSCVTFLLSRLRSGRWLFFSAGMTGLVALSLGGLVLFDLDTLVIKELSTLKDPVSESTSRLLHWGDTLPVVLDFPLLGTGLGSYRYSTLPYQRHYWGTWFQRADNQYVEVLVEGGVCGLTLALLFGLTAAFLAGRVCLVRSAQAVAPASSWLASGCLAMIIGIGAAAVLDYGVSLPSTSAILVGLTAMMERRNPVGVQDSNSGGLTKYVWVLIVSAICLSSFRLMPELRNVAKSYEAMAPTQRFLKSITSESPDSEHSFQHANELRLSLEKSLAVLPDHQEGRRVHAQISLRCLQEAMCDSLSGKQLLSGPQRAAVLRNLQLPSVAVTLQSSSAEIQNEWRDQWSKAGSKLNLDWYQVAADAKREFLWIPDLSVNLTATSILLRKQDEGRFVRLSLLLDPAAAQDNYLLGMILNAAHFSDDAESVWTQSLAASERYRPEILKQAVTGRSIEDVLARFGPTDYASCIECAERMKNSADYFGRLLAKADQGWPGYSEYLTPEKCLMRARHLDLAESSGVAADWLGQQLAEFPYEHTLRRKRAELLERAGRNAEAYDEWLRVQAFEPDDTIAGAALKRLIRLPPTTEPGRK